MADQVLAVAGKRKIAIQSVDALHSLLAETGGEANEELWLVSPGGPSLCMLRAGDRAMIAFLRHDGDTGFTSRSNGPVAGPRTVRFTLSNGQLDEYPASWTVSAAVGRDVVEHFFRTSEMAPFVGWNDDGAG